MRAMFPFLIVTLLLASPADAGAWLKEKGGGFLSFGATILRLEGEPTFRIEQTAYAEYGVSETLTLGASYTSIDSLSMQAIAFARFPVKTFPSDARLSAEVGVGVKQSGLNRDPILAAGLSWGKGISRKDKSGWVNVDSALHVNLATNDVSLKIDGTYGLTMSPNMRFLLQGFSEVSETGHSLTVSPGLIFTPSWLKKLQPVVSLERRMGTRASTGLRIALWRSF